MMILLLPSLCKLKSTAENYLNALPPSTIKHKFVDLKDLQRKLAEYLQNGMPNTTANQFLVFSNIPEDQVLGDGNEYSIYGGQITYSRTQKILVIKMPKEAQQVAKIGFTHLVDKKSMRWVSDSIEETGSTTRIYRDWIKEPDSSWEVEVETTAEALSAQQQMMKNLSLILETVIVGGSSEDGDEDEVTGNGKFLNLDARTWIEAKVAEAKATAEIGTVTKLVITLQIASDTPHITIQVWERERERDGNGNGDGKTQAIRTELVQVSYNNSTNTTTALGSINLPFWGVYLRAADVLRNPLERDIVLRRLQSAFGGFRDSWIHLSRYSKD